MRKTQCQEPDMRHGWQSVQSKISQQQQIEAESPIRTHPVVGEPGQIASMGSQTKTQIHTEKGRVGPGIRGNPNSDSLTAKT